MTVSNRHRARRVTKSRVTSGAVSKYYLELVLDQELGLQRLSWSWSSCFFVLALTSLKVPQELEVDKELVLDQKLGLQSLSWSWSWNSWFFVLVLASLDVPLELELDKELVLDQELEHLRGCCWRLLGL